MKDSDRYGDYRTGQNVVFKYVPDYSSPLMLEGVIKNIVTNGSGTVSYTHLTLPTKA